MAAVATLKRSAVNFVVIKGTDPDTGKETLANVALQDVQGSPDADAVIGIKTALAVCLAFPVKRVEHTRVDIISEE